MIKVFAHWWAGIVYRYAVVILIVVALMTGFAFKSTLLLKVSTGIDALMPKGAKSVQTLNAALEKTGSFASVQIVVQSDNPETSLAFIKDAKRAIDQYEWVQSSQYFEDIKTLEKHKLLLLSLKELLQIEQDINQAYPTYVAKKLANVFGVEVTFTLSGDELSGNSNTNLDQGRFDEIQTTLSAPKQTRRLFVSDDGLTAVLVIWPKQGKDTLTGSKYMVKSAQDVLNRLAVEKYETVQAGVVGRIASTVLQFDAIMDDLKRGLLGAVVLIILLLVLSYRSFAAVPAIFIPLAIGIIWALGLTAATIGSLNLITVFLTLILFGLGIDFGIHNFSRYREERRNGAPTAQAVETVIYQTGSASLIAALTTACSFFALLLTEFRAFTEFGFIAGSGIILIFISMYTVFPALLVVMEKLGWQADEKLKIMSISPQLPQLFNPLKHRKFIFTTIATLMLFAAIFAPKMQFEQNMKNLEARLPASYVAAKAAARQVLKTSNSRAIITVETQEEMIAIDKYFKHKITTDSNTPTIKKISSLLDFVPSQDSQAKRLRVIRRLEKRAKNLKGLDPERYMTDIGYLSIGALNIADLPQTLRRTYLGTDGTRGYLMYVENAVDLDDNRLAQQYYDDVASFAVGGQTYYSASEGFIFVEMLALMKADALKAVLLVILTTILLVFLFIRNLKGTLIILAPPLFGIFITVGVMGAFGPSLSIMNMVILPSLVGISVDNSIHIFHRFQSASANVDISHIMNTTGRAAVLTTLTTLIGFGGMITASMGGLRSMGILAIIGFLSCLVMTWMLLPVLLQAYPICYTKSE